ncbi:MAG: type 1 glutamine amidotransferase [Flavobacteriaceae bacterium]|jgi:type 1 glutamine amidotransferase|tara:strand:+ start:984 stop:1724 length:741 start_codon:yes stop_codon:yes gene_type:complete
MKKKQFVSLILCLLSQVSFAQFENGSLESKNVLIVYGGWKGHQPKVFADKIGSWLEQQNANVTLSSSTAIYLDEKIMSNTDLIIQHITMSTIKAEESKALQKVVSRGVGLAGCHGGLGDAFRDDTEYQYMIGGQFVKHPGGQLDYTVNMTTTENVITKGIKDFSLHSEQYYLHIDPAINVLATTVFNGDNDSWIEGIKMPVVWTKIYGKGRVFYSSLGHSADVFEIPEVWQLMTRGVAWATKSKIQ